MNRRRFIISAAIVFIVVEILDYIIHQIILQSTYMVLRSVLRPEAEMQSKRWIVFVTALIWPFLFVYIYTKGYEGREVVEGKRYGLWIGLFSLFQMAYSWYVILSVPYSVDLQWPIYKRV